MTLHSIEAYKATGVSRSSLNEILVYRFAIPELLKDLFPTYFLRYWSKKFFLAVTSQQSIRKDAILVDGIFYLIQYHKCTRGDILRLQDSSQVCLSFRAAKPEFNLPAYVLVSISQKSQASNGA